MPAPLTLFLADDDPDDVELFLTAVKDYDSSTKVITASDGEEALRILIAMLPSTPDLIFLDLNMPRVNGKMVLRELKETDRLRDVPVVIYTTSSREEDKMETRKLGASFYFTKPSSFIGLSMEVSKIISSVTHNNGKP